MRRQARHGSVGVDPARDRVRLVTIVTTALLLSTSSFAEVYKWTDAQGRVHYGDRPRPTAQAIAVDPVAPLPSPEAAQRRAKRDRLLETYAEERRDERTAADNAKRLREQRRRNCETARKNSFELEHSAYIYETDVQGKRRILTDAEHIATRRMAADEVQKWCGL